MSSITYLELHTPEDFERATDIEIEVWGLDPRDAIPANLFRALTHNGGVLIGACAGKELIGITFAFAAQRDGRSILWSHVTGVLPTYQGQRIGEGLKLAQRQWAAQHGIDEIRWTFDPLQRGNANFNLARLGAIADTYHVNLYGTMTDAINAGMPSDRIEASWQVQAALPPIDIEPSLPVALSHNAHHQPVSIEVGSVEQFLVEIPQNLKMLRAKHPHLVLEWRLALRKTLIDAFSKGYVATAFVSTPSHPQEAYLLTRLRR